MLCALLPPSSPHRACVCQQHAIEWSPSWPAALAESVGRQQHRASFSSAVPHATVFDFYSLVTLLLTGEASFTPSLALLPHHSFISSFTSLLHHSFISSSFFHLVHHFAQRPGGRVGRGAESGIHLRGCAPTAGRISSSVGPRAPRMMILRLLFMSPSVALAGPIRRPIQQPPGEHRQPAPPLAWRPDGGPSVCVHVRARAPEMRARAASLTRAGEVMRQSTHV
jgi:hypothetical protein